MIQKQAVQRRRRKRRWFLMSAHNCLEYATNTWSQLYSENIACRLSKKCVVVKKQPINYLPTICSIIILAIIISSLDGHAAPQPVAPGPVQLNLFNKMASSISDRVASQQTKYQQTPPSVNYDPITSSPTQYPRDHIDAAQMQPEASLVIAAMLAGPTSSSNGKQQHVATAKSARMAAHYSLSCPPEALIHPCTCMYHKPGSTLEAEPDEDEDDIYEISPHLALTTPNAEPLVMSSTTTTARPKIVGPTKAAYLKPSSATTIATPITSDPASTRPLFIEPLNSINTSTMSSSNANVITNLSDEKRTTPPIGSTIMNATNTNLAPSNSSLIDSGIPGSNGVTATSEEPATATTMKVPITVSAVSESELKVTTSSTAGKPALDSNSNSGHVELNKTASISQVTTINYQESPSSTILLIEPKLPSTTSTTTATPANTQMLINNATENSESSTQTSGNKLEKEFAQSQADFVSKSPLPATTSSNRNTTIAQMSTKVASQNSTTTEAPATLKPIIENNVATESTLPTNMLNGILESVASSQATPGTSSASASASTMASPELWSATSPPAATKQDATTDSSPPTSTRGTLDKNSNASTISEQTSGQVVEPSPNSAIKSNIAEQQAELAPAMTLSNKNDCATSSTTTTTTTEPTTASATSSTMAAENSSDIQEAASSNSGGGALLAASLLPGSSNSSGPAAQLESAVGEDRTKLAVSETGRLGEPLSHDEPKGGNSIELVHLNYGAPNAHNQPAQSSTPAASGLAESASPSRTVASPANANSSLESSSPSVSSETGESAATKSTMNNNGTSTTKPALMSPLVPISTIGLLNSTSLRKPPANATADPSGEHPKVLLLTTTLPANKSSPNDAPNHANTSKSNATRLGQTSVNNNNNNSSSAATANQQAPTNNGLIGSPSDTLHRPNSSRLSNGRVLATARAFQLHRDNNSTGHHKLELGLSSNNTPHSRLNSSSRPRHPSSHSMAPSPGRANSTSDNHQSSPAAHQTLIVAHKLKPPATTSANKHHSRQSNQAASNTLANNHTVNQQPNQTSQSEAPKALVVQSIRVRRAVAKPQRRRFARFLAQEDESSADKVEVLAYCRNIQNGAVLREAIRGFRGHQVTYFVVDTCKVPAFPNDLFEGVDVRWLEMSNSTLQFHNNFLRSRQQQQHQHYSH